MPFDTEVVRSPWVPPILTVTQRRELGKKRKKLSIGSDPFQDQNKRTFITSNYMNICRIQKNLHHKWTPQISALHRFHRLRHFPEIVPTLLFKKCTSNAIQLSLSSLAFGPPQLHCPFHGIQRLPRRNVQSNKRKQQRTRRRRPHSEIYKFRWVSRFTLHTS